MMPQVTERQRMSGRNTRALQVLVLLMVWIAACGPPRYDLTVRVTETDGTAIPEASVTLLELQDVQVTDEAGEASWTDLEADTIVLYVSAEGYMAYAGKIELARGHSETVVMLERAPIDPDVLGP
jgi:hypothetical protein